MQSEPGNWSSFLARPGIPCPMSRSAPHPAAAGREGAQLCCAVSAGPPGPGWRVHYQNWNILQEGVINYTLRISVSSLGHNQRTPDSAASNTILALSPNWLVLPHNSSCTAPRKVTLSFFLIDNDPTLLRLNTFIKQKLISREETNIRLLNTFHFDRPLTILGSVLRVAFVYCTFCWVAQCSAIRRADVNTQYELMVWIIKLSAGNPFE